jgi:hypothetical protein
MGNTSFGDSNKITNDFITAENAFNVSSQQLAKRVICNYNVRDVNFRPVGAPTSAGKEVTIVGGLSKFDRTFLTTSFKLHIERLKNYAKAYFNYTKINPAVSRSIAANSTGLAGLAQQMGMEEDQELLTFSRNFVIERILNAYKNFKSNQSLDALRILILSIQESQELSIDPTPEMIKMFKELDQQDLTFYGLKKNFFSSSFLSQS